MYYHTYITDSSPKCSSVERLYHALNTKYTTAASIQTTKTKNKKHASKHPKPTTTPGVPPLHSKTPSHRKLGTLVARAKQAQAAHDLRHAHPLSRLLFKRVEDSRQHLLSFQSARVNRLSSTSERELHNGTAMCVFLGHRLLTIAKKKAPGQG